MFWDMKSTDQAKETKNQVLVAAAEEEEIDRLFVGIMEGYKDYLIPPLSEFSTPTLLLHGTPTASIYDIGGGGLSSSKNCAHNQRKRAANNNNNEDDHVDKERKRRGKMAEMFSVLQSMVVPTLHHKATREETVSNTIEYIQKLEKEIARLEDLKMRRNSITLLPESMADAKPTFYRCTSRNSSVEVNVNDGVTFFGVQSSAIRRGLVVGIFTVLERYRVEVLTANVTVDDGRRKLTVTAIIGGNRVEDTIEKIKKEILLVI